MKKILWSILLMFGFMINVSAINDFELSKTINKNDVKYGRDVNVTLEVKASPIVKDINKDIVVFGFFDDAFCVGNAARHSVQNLKMAVRIFCDYVCERGFSRAGRTVEDATSQSVRGNRPS